MRYFLLNRLPCQGKVVILQSKLGVLSICAICMTRKELYDYVEERIAVLAYRVEMRGKLNILDLHLHSENFYRDFLNLLYGWNLENLNKTNQNVEAIDLIDEAHQLVVQVSATNTKQKIENTLSKELMAKYSGWTFKFVSIAKSADGLREKSYVNRYGLQFEPKKDVVDVASLLREILNLQTDDLKKVYDFVRREFGNDLTAFALESDLVRVITMLANVDASEFDGFRLENEFEVEDKIDFNSLVGAADVIREYNVWQMAVRRVYAAFDAEGTNKSFFVLQKIRSFYIAHKQKMSADELFDAVRGEVKNEIMGNASSKDLSVEAIDVCADILVVDAFIRCKIFENPKGYSNVTA